MGLEHQEFAIGFDQREEVGAFASVVCDRQFQGVFGARDDAVLVDVSLFDQCVRLHDQATDLAVEFVAFGFQAAGRAAAAVGGFANAGVDLLTPNRQRCAEANAQVVVARPRQD